MKRMSRTGALFVALFLLAVVAQLGRADQKCHLTYANFGKAFVEKYCLLCHDSHKSFFMRMGAPAGYFFDQAEVIEKYKDEIIRWAVVKHDMPPRWMPDQPTKAEREQLLEWLDCEYGPPPK